MKNTYMKTVVACLATLLLIGPQNRTVEAITEYKVVKGDSLWKLGQQHRKNNRRDDMMYTGEILKMADQSKEAAIQSSEPKKETQKRS